MPETALVRLVEDEAGAPLPLMKALTAHYGVEWLGWSYDTLRMTLERELHVAVPARVLNRAMSMAAVALQDAFWLEWEHFHFLVQAINGDVPDALNHKELTVGQMMLAVRTAEQVRQELGRLSYTLPFSEEVSRYVAAQALHQSVWYLPAPLEFAAHHASGLRYRCKDCGNDSEVLFDDGLCDVCVHRFDTSSLGAWEPDPALVAKGWGRRIEFYEKNPTAAVRKRLAEVRARPNVTLQENPTDVCTARLVAALQYAGYAGQEGA